MNPIIMHLFRQLTNHAPLLEQLQGVCRDLHPPEAKDILKPWLQEHQSLWSSAEAIQNEVSLDALDYRCLLGFIKRDLSHQDLTGVDFSGLALDGFDFSHSRLIRARLRRTSFTRADMTGVDLTGADADHAFFDEACLVEAVLINGQFLHTSWSFADMHHADLSRADFTGASLFQTNLLGVRAQATTARLVMGDRACLSGSDWSHSELIGASFQNALLNEIQMQHARVDYANFDGASLQKANLFSLYGEHTSFKCANLENANLEKSVLLYSLLEKANLRGANLGGMSARGALFDDATFSSETVIEASSHDLIAAVLEASATTFQQRMFAAVIRKATEYCWEEFTRELKKRPELISWVEQTLTSYPSLERMVTYAKWILDH